MGDRRRVLVVDDDAAMHVLLAIALPEYELLEASRWIAGLEMANNEQPDAVIVDERLPDGPGVSLVRELRRDRRLRGVPVLVVTAGHEEEERLRFLQAGADEYLPKPFEPGDLRARIERLAALDPADLRRRREDLMGRVRAGEHGDLDPPRRSSKADGNGHRVGAGVDGRGSASLHGLFGRRGAHARPAD